jgi:hypothetical protein
MRKIFEATRDEETGRWGKQPREELHGLYLSLNIMMAIKWRKM